MKPQTYQMKNKKNSAPAVDVKREELERALIGAALLEPALVCARAEKRNVTPVWFDVPEAAVVWNTILTLWRQPPGQVDPLIVRSKMGGAVPGRWLMDCINMCPSAHNAESYIEQLASLRLTSQLESLLIDCQRNLTTLTPQETMDAIEGQLAALRDTEKESYGSFSTIEDFAEQSIQDYTTLVEKRKTDKTYYLGQKLPWDVLDTLYTGVKEGIHIIAARPSQGKTAIAVNLAAGIAITGTRSLIFSVDMPSRQMAERFASFFGLVSLAKLGFAGSEKDLANFTKGFKVAAKIGRKKNDPPKLLFSDSSRVDRMIGEIHRAYKYENVRAVFVDYLQILNGDKHYSNRKEELDDILQRLKKCAQSLHIPIFTLAQLNRENGKDPSRKPQLTDLGDSGAIEREASTVLALWRDPDVTKTWEQTPPLAIAGGHESLAKNVRPMWLLLLKNQQGATGERPFIFYPNYFLFRPAEHDAVPIHERDKNDRVIKTDRSPYFAAVRDDFIELHAKDGDGFDDLLEAHGALGFRGIKNLHKEKVVES